MKSKRNALWSIFLALVLISSMVACNGGAKSGQPSESVADAVMKAKRIRAGYAVVSPAVIKDPGTGELSGIFIDTMREVGKRLSLEVDFTEEVAWDSMIAGLTARRYDIISTQVWPSAPRSREAAFTKPLYFTAIGVYVRANDHRFDNNLSALNSESIRVAGIEGASSLIIAATDFPRAKLVAIPGTADTNQQFLDVASNRADVVFLDTYQGESYIKNNPGSLRNIVPDRPIRVFPDAFMVKRDEFHFLTMLNTTIDELTNSGFIDKLIDKYANVPGSILHPAYEYRTTAGRTGKSGPNQ